MSEKEEKAGAAYAKEQFESDYFMEWYRDQIHEAFFMDPSKVLPLETKADAEVIARNMLQDLEWGIKGEVSKSRAFLKGVSDYLNRPEVIDELAAEVLDFHEYVKSMWGDDAEVGEAREAGGRGKHEWIYSEELRPGDVIAPTKQEGGGEWTIVSGPTETTVQRGEYTVDMLEFEIRSGQETHTVRYPWEGSVRILKRSARGAREARRQQPRRRLPPSKDIPVPAIPVYGEGDPNANFAIETLVAHGGRRTKWRFDSGYYATLEDAIAMSESLIGFHDIGWFKGVRVVDVRQGYKPVWEWPERKRRFGREAQAARGRPAPLIEDKLYTVTWVGGRKGPMTAGDTVAFVNGLRQSWRESGRSDPLKIQVWYRDGSPVPFADLERQVKGPSQAPRRRRRRR
jgi:hypothetical protein